VLSHLSCWQMWRLQSFDPQFISSIFQHFPYFSLTLSHASFSTSFRQSQSDSPVRALAKLSWNPYVPLPSSLFTAQCLKQPVPQQELGSWQQSRWPPSIAQQPSPLQQRVPTIRNFPLSSQHNLPFGHSSPPIVQSLQHVALL